MSTTKLLNFIKLKDKKSTSSKKLKRLVYTIVNQPLSLCRE